MAFFSAIAAAAASWIGALSIGKIALQLAIGTGLSLAGQALQRSRMGQQRGRAFGVTGQLQSGGRVPRSFPLGITATEGSLVYANFWGESGKTPNAFLTWVIALSDIPNTELLRIAVDGRWCTIRATDDVDHPERGRPVEEYIGDNVELYVKFLDGTQTAADPFLMSSVASSERPWGANRVGKGVAYVIVTARANPKKFQGFPKFVFELRGKCYDITKDSTRGGSGSQRWNSITTWGGDGDLLPACHAYVLYRGVYYLGRWLYGLQAMTDARLPHAKWREAVEACRQTVGHSEGAVPRYRAGGMFSVDMEIGDAIEAELMTCDGAPVDAGGAYWISVGPPGAPVAHINGFYTTESLTEKPIRSLGDTITGVALRAPRSGTLYKITPIRTMRDTGLEAAIGGREALSELEIALCPYPEQVQRLGKAALREVKRERRVTGVLPPEFWLLNPRDIVTVTRPESGFNNKRFRVTGLFDRANGDIGIELIEVDPSDYDWSSPVDYTPPVDGSLTGPRVPPSILVPGWSAAARIVFDEAGRPRRAGIDVLWPLDDDVEAVQIQVRHRNTAANPRKVVDVRYEEWRAGSTTIIAAGIVGSTDYQVRGRHIPISERDTEWCPWLNVTTPDVGLLLEDLAPSFRDQIREGFQNAEDAADEAARALALANQVSSDLETITGDDLQEWKDFVATLDGIDPETIKQGALLALRSDSWLADPGFMLWNGTDTAPLHWTVNGINRASRFSGFYGGGIQVQTAAGQTFTMYAHSSIAGEAPAADARAEWVLVSIVAELDAGNPASVQVRPTWSATGGASTWQSGTDRTDSTASGNLSNFGFTARPGVMQAARFLVKRPNIGAEHVRVGFYVLGNSTVPTIVKVHLVSIRAASEAEVEAGLAAKRLDARVTEERVQITDEITGAIASYNLTVTARFNDNNTFISNTYATKTSVTTSIAAVEQSIVASRNSTLATVANTYQTIANGNSAIAALRTNLEGQVGSVAANLSDEAALRAQADNALAGRVQRVEVTTGGNLFRNPDLAMGPPETGAPPAGWQTFNGVDRVARNASSSTNAIRLAPTAFFARSSGDGFDTAWNVRGVPVRPGQRLTPGLWVCGTGSGVDRQVGLRLLFKDADGVAMSPVVTRRTQVTTLTWRHVREQAEEVPANDRFRDVPVPEGAATVDLGVDVTAGTGTVNWTMPEANFSDPVAKAIAERADVVAARADRSSASMVERAEADFGSFNAFVSDTKAVVTTVNSARAASILKVDAGGASASMRLVAWDNPQAVGSAIVFDAANIIATGTISAAEIVVQEHERNLVPDNQIQSKNAWRGDNAFEIVKQTQHDDADSVGEFRFRRNGDQGYQTIRSLAFRVRPGDRLLGGFQALIAGSGTRMRAGVRLVFRTRRGVYLNRSELGWIETTNGGMQEFERSKDDPIIVPSGGRQCEFEYVVDTAGPATNGDVRLFAPKVFRQADGALLITPNSIDGAKLVRGSKLIFETAEIGELILGKKHFGSGAIGQVYQAQTSREDALRVGDPWETLLSLTIDGATAGTAGACIDVFFDMQLIVRRYVATVVEIRARIGNTTVWSRSYNHLSEGAEPSAPTAINRASFLSGRFIRPISDGQTIRIEARITTGIEAIHRSSEMAAMLVFAVKT